MLIIYSCELMLVSCFLLEILEAASPPNSAAEDEQTQLVCRGPSEEPPNFVFPMNESDGRSCQHQYFRTTLVKKCLEVGWCILKGKTASSACPANYLESSGNEDKERGNY